MSEADQELQRHGSEARVAGQCEFDNPYYRPEAMPVRTGEATEAWHRKAEQWRIGWTLEDVMRH